MDSQRVGSDWQKKKIHSQLDYHNVHYRLAAWSRSMLTICYLDVYLIYILFEFLLRIRICLGSMYYFNDSLTDWKQEYAKYTIANGTRMIIVERMVTFTVGKEFLSENSFICQTWRYAGTFLSLRAALCPLGWSSFNWPPSWGAQGAPPSSA